MGGPKYQLAQSPNGSAAVDGDAPVKIGGVAQGSVSLSAQNTGGNDCWVLPSSDGSTPTADTIRSTGEYVASTGTFSSVGEVYSLQALGVSPQFWAVCQSGNSTTVAWQERT